MPGNRITTWLRERRLLLGLSVGLPLAEMGILAAFGNHSGMGLAGQVTAPGPFGVFHDLRLLFVFHDSIVWFVLGAAALVAGRSLLAALLVRSAWPGEAPPFGLLVRHMLVITAAAAILLSPWVTLMFGAAVIPLSWIYFSALAPALATILLLHHGGVDGGWWRRLPPARSAAWMALSFLVLSLSALGVAGQPGPVVAVVLAATGLWNAWAWEHSVRVIVTGLPGRSHRLAPVTVVSVVLVFGVVVGGSQIGFAVRAYVDPGVWVPGDARAGDRAVLLVGGFASACCDEGPILQGDTPGVYVEQFSYAGLTAKGDPRPHAGSATDADLSRMARLVAVQVNALAADTGGPVALVAESEGTLVATAYLEAYPNAPVDRLMLLSPIVDPGRATFPDPGEEGFGVVAGYELRAVTGLIDAMAPFVISADSPLTDSVRREAEELRGEAVCDRPAIEEIVVVPLADAVMSPPGSEPGIEVITVPGFHGGLRGRPDVQAMIRQWVQGADLEGSDLGAAVGQVLSGSASAWQVPGLDGVAGGEPDCAAAG
ncbi:MAG: hypothetical protein H6Q11_250 [Acidobacteria bacterium]|nr:hypothetical protein [Acidobacteriota bacterium]